jgi:hypothetical protein
MALHANPRAHVTSGVSSRNGTFPWLARVIRFALESFAAAGERTSCQCENHDAKTDGQANAAVELICNWSARLRLPDAHVSQRLSSL